MNAPAAVFALSAAFMLGYGPAYCLTVAIRQRRDRRQLARTPRVDVGGRRAMCPACRKASLSRPRAHLEWSRLQAAVAQARADIAAEAEHFDMWTKEMSA